MTIAYAPSLMVLEALKNRPSVVSRPAVRLLSVACPDFTNITRKSGAVATRYLDILRADGLATLPGTRTESDRIAEVLGSSRVRQLLGLAATEGGLRKELSNACPMFLHLATHGIASSDAVSGESALALAATANRPANRDDDGFLEVSEIYELPLAGCELAVLSACSTNIGAQHSQEMGSTVTRAFLGAGTRRVIASQWPVKDEATAQLMAQFFGEIAASLRSGSKCNYSVALQKARDSVRKRPDGKWASPVYWAPFVLIGPEI